MIDTALPVIHMAIDTSFASDPAVKFVARIAGIVLLIVLVIRGVLIYADKSKRGELITEAIVGIVCAGFVTSPETVMTMFATLWGFIAAWATNQS